MPWQRKRTDALTRCVEITALMGEAKDPFASTQMPYTYTRKHALNDGVQLEVSFATREARLNFSVYLAHAVWKNVRVRNGVAARMNRAVSRAVPLKL